MIERLLVLENSWAQGHTGDWCLLRPVLHLQTSQSSLLSIPYYEGQAELLEYSNALTLELDARRERSLDHAILSNYTSVLLTRNSVLSLVAR